MQANFLDRAKQGDPHAIATLMNQALTHQGVTVQAAMRRGCLHILMESDHPLEPARIVPALRKAMQDLQSPVISRVRIYGHQKSETSSIWSQVIDLSEDISQPLTITQANLVNNLGDEPPTAIRAALMRSHQDGGVALKTFDHTPTATTTTTVLLSPSAASTPPAPPLPPPLGREPQPEPPTLYQAPSQQSHIATEAKPLSPTDLSTQVQPESEVSLPPSEIDSASSPYEHPSLSKTQAVNVTPRKPPTLGKRSSALTSWGIVGAFVCGIGLGSWFLWRQPLAKTAQNQSLAQETLQPIPKLEDAKDLADLESQESQIQTRLAQLMDMPATADIQKQVGLLQGRLGQVKQRLENERQAKNNLLLAERLINEAEAELTSGSKTEGSNTATQKLKAAIRLLEVSPAKTFASENIQMVLTQLQRRLTQVQPSATPVAISAEKTLSTPATTEAPTPNVVKASAAAIQINLRATGKSWLQVESEGKILFEGIVDKGIQQTWQAKSKLIVRVGNAGFVVASRQGVAPKPLGELGDVLEVKYTSKGATSRHLK